MKANNPKQIIIIAAAALLLTACSESGSSVSDSRAETTTAQTTATAADAGSATVSAETTTDAGSSVLTEQTTDITTTAAAAVTETDVQTAEQQQTYPVSSDEKVLFADKVVKDKLLPLSCAGKVYAVDGLNLRTKASEKSQSLRVVRNLTDVEVQGVVVTGDIHDYTKRWLKVRVGSEEGYMLAEYVKCSVTDKLGNLSPENRTALGIILYYQSMRLYVEFEREGGVPNLKRTGITNEEGFEKLEPKHSIAKLRADFHKYFSKNYSDQFIDSCYHEETDGYLWTATGYGDNVLLESTSIDRIDRQEDGALTYNITVHWRNFDDDINFKEYEEIPFRLVYEDGCWKVEEMTCLY